jgi:hypothetical protein
MKCGLYTKDKLLVAGFLPKDIETYGIVKSQTTY